MRNKLRKKIITNLSFIKRGYTLDIYKKRISLFLVLILVLQCLFQPNCFTYADSPVDIEAPSAPADLTVESVSGSAISLSWIASTDNIGIKEYQVYGNANNMGSTTDTHYTCTGLTEGITYSFYVIAYDDAGNASEQSNTVTALIPGASDTTAPSAPTNLSILSVSGSAIALSWNAAVDNVGVKDYGIYVNNALIGNTIETYYTYMGLSEGNTYEFYVIAYDEAGNSSNPSNIVAKPADVQAPEAPQNLMIESVTGSAITLKWDSNPGNIGISKYGIYNNGSLIGETEESSFTYSQLIEGNTYNFHVAAYDLEQNISAPSNSVAITLEMQAPTAPQNPRIESVSGSAITLTWDASTDNIGINKYDIYCNDILVGETAVTSFTYNQLVAGSIYNFYLIAYDMVMNPSAPSDIVTMPYEIQAPEAPANLMIESVSGSAISLKWEAAASPVGISKYIVYCNNNMVGETSEANYVFNKIDSQDTYSFYVVAYDILNNASEQSNTVEFVFDTIAPEAPKNLRVVTASDMTVSLEWDASIDEGGLKEYKIYCNTNFIGTTNETNYVCTGLTEGLTYEFYVLAYDNAGNASEQSNIIYAAIGYSINLEAINVTDSTVDLTWTFQNNVNGNVVYKVFRDGVEIGVTSDTQYSDSELTQGMEYTYSVCAYDENNNLVGTSALINVNTIDTQAPSAPENFRLVSIKGTTAVLAWDESTDNTGVVGYNVYLWDNYLLGSTTDDTIVINNLYSHTTLPLFVRAYDAVGNLSPINYENPLLVSTGYEIPYNLQINDADKGFEISWDITYLGSGYDWFELSINDEVIQLPMYTTSYIQTDIMPNQIYEYKVRTVKYSGEYSEWSDSVKILNAAVTNLSVNEININSSELTWDPVAGASSYEIEINGVLIGAVSETSFIYNNISVISNTYKVRPIIGGLKGIWSTYLIWESSGSPYVLNNGLDIPKNTTLLVRPGVVLRFARDVVGLKSTVG